VLLALVASAAVGVASDEGPPAPTPPAVIARDAEGRATIRAVRIEEPLTVDGVLDEGHYQAILPIADFIQQEPREGEPASEKTEVWVLFDRQHLYVSARCHDSQPERIVGNDMRRDGRNVGQNDNLSLMLDTFHDRRNGYEFLINSVGGMVDNQITDERDINRHWNTVWFCKSRRDARGWTAEIAIPFRSLRYRAGGRQVWGINIRRSVWWKNEYHYVSPVPRIYGPRGILRVSSAATLVGVEAPASSLNLELKPYAVSGVKADRAVDRALDDDFERDAGFDAKYGVTRSLTADLTFRTDFAQVEDDDQQVNLTRFSVFFPEKRDFFLEGQGIFAFGGVETAPRPGNVFAAASNTPVLFFSRRIGLAEGRPVPIQAGGRLTGKAGRYSIGVLDIQTAKSESPVAAATNFGVVRVKREVLRRSYVGVIGTRRSPGESRGSNLAFGADANLSFFESLNILGYYARTDTPGRAGPQDSYRARFDYDADLLGVQLERLAVAKDFDPEVGFLRRRDFVGNLAQLRVSRRPRFWAAARKLSLEAGLDYITDGRGRLENRQARLLWRTDMQRGDSWSLQCDRNFEFLPRPFEVSRGVVVPVGEYRTSSFRAGYTLGTQRRVSGDLSLGRGGFYAGDRTELAYRGRAELHTRLSLEPGLSLNRVELPQGRFTARLFSARATFSFSPSLFLASLVQYNSSNSLFSTNVRLRWEYRPGSELFVVYGDNRDTLAPRPIALQNRSVLIKLTRLFRF
jgi:hypothetical protein